MKWYHFWVEFVFGLGILFWDKIAVLLLFIYLVIRLTLIYEYLRKLIRIYQISNEAKIMAIVKKLKITKEEITKNYEEEELAKLTPKQKQQLEKDVNDIMRF
ncbi:hypothetical protein HY025_00010 [Candidatus Daviesbacteria bacterium]|nr:hypothetical protein [Candidatus Daviesbacteria bacterium]